MIEQQKELYSVCKYTKYTHLEDPKKGSDLGQLNLYAMEITEHQYLGMLEIQVPSLPLGNQAKTSWSSLPSETL